MADKNKEKPQTTDEHLEAIDRKGDVVFVGPFSEVIEAIKQDANLGVKVVHVWLARHAENDDPTNPVMIFQKRSDNGRLDKFVGGHVSSGMTFDETALKEIDEEMHGLPVRLVTDLGSKALEGVDLTETAALLPFSGMPWVVSKRHGRGGEAYDKPTRVMTYLGLYDGPLDDITHDFEVQDMQTMRLSEALQAIQDNPDHFTPDVVDHLPQVADAFRAIGTSEQPPATHEIGHTG